MVMTLRPAGTEYAPFYETYVSLVPETNVLDVLDGQPDVVRRLASRIAADRETFRYAPRKWSIREVFGHVGDAERVFGYRAFCISRGEQADLPSFDEQSYTPRGRFDECSVAALVEDWAALRATNLRVLQRLTPDQWETAGRANSAPITVRALAYILAGHVRHHVGVLRSRYGVAEAG